LIGIGWYIIIGIISFILIYYKFVKLRKRTAICGECGLSINANEAYTKDKITDTKYHYNHWWQKIEREFFNEFLEVVHANMRKEG